MSVSDCGRMRGAACPVQEREGRERAEAHLHWHVLLPSPAPPPSYMELRAGYHHNTSPGLDIDFFPLHIRGWLSPSLLLTGNALNSPVIESELRYWNVFCMQVSKLRLKQPITQITGSIFITSQLKILEILLATISKVSGTRLMEGRRPWGHFVTFSFARIFYKLKVENDNKHLKYSPKSGQYFFKI